MKRLSVLSLLLLGMSSLSLAQIEVNRTHVLTEIFTGTWCVFCPGSAMGADDMYHNDLDVSIIEYHIGDAYEIPASTARDTYYDVGGYPTTVFDGTDQFSGGNTANTMYPTYLTHYQSAIAVTTPIAMELSAERTGTSVTAQVKTTQVADLGNNANNLVMYAAVIESHIQESWFMMDEINFVLRDLLPSSAGQPILLSVGQTDTITFQITLDPSWDPENSQVVVFIQHPTTKEIFNSDMMSLATPTEQHDAQLVQLLVDFEETYCPDAQIGPVFKISNQGATPLTQLDIQYTINGGSPLVESWTGNLLRGFSDTVSIPTLAVTPQAGPNVLQIIGVNPNGQADENQANDSLSADWLYPTADAGVYYMVVKPDAYGSETSWKIFNALDSVVAEGGPYTNGNTDLVYLEVDLSEGEGCHRLEVYDSQGNGMSAVSQGYFRLLDPLGMPVTQSLDGDFGFQATYRFTLPEIEDPTAREDLLADQLQVFPNPSSGLVQVQFPAFQGQWVELSLMDLSGRTLSQIRTMDGQHQLDLSAQPTGMYLVKLSTEQGYQSVKLSKH